MFLLAEIMNLPHLLSLAFLCLLELVLTICLLNSVSENKAFPAPELDIFYKTMLNAVTLQ